MLVKVLLWRKQGIKILVKANVPILIKISILQQQQNILVFFPKLETILCHGEWEHICLILPNARVVTEVATLNVL